MKSATKIPEEPKKGLAQLAESQSAWQRITEAVTTVLEGPHGLRV